MKKISIEDLITSAECCYKLNNCLDCHYVHYNAIGAECIKKLLEGMADKLKEMRAMEDDG